MKMVLKKGEKCYNQSIISINLSAEPAFRRKTDTHVRKLVTHLKEIGLLDFESTVTLGYKRFYLIKTCLSPSRKPLL